MRRDLKLQEAKEQALALMDTSGYSLSSEIDFSVDNDLPFMGYTTEKHGKPHIVVSKNALQGGMAINLLIHELSHVYRTQSGHPSHNYHILTTIMSFVMKGKILHPYQEEIVHTLINHLQDIYADDISFTIFKKQKQTQDLSEFFLSWVHQPSNSSDQLRKAWDNAAALVSAAFAQANLERHEVKDTDGKVEKTIQAFLKTLGNPYADTYLFFKKFMVLLPEKVTDKEYETLLIAYLNEFSKLIKK